MKSWSILGLICAGAVTAGVTGSWMAWRSPAARASETPSGRTPPAASTVTILHKHVVSPEPEERRGPANVAVERNAPEVQGPSEQEMLFEMEQAFEATAESFSVQRRNEDTLRRMLSRVAGGKALPIDGFSCRGDSCRVAFKFESLDQTRATLNELPRDEEWTRSGFGFNALPKDPTNPASNEWVVYFTSSQDVSSKN